MVSIKSLKVSLQRGGFYRRHRRNYVIPPDRFRFFGGEFYIMAALRIYVVGRYMTYIGLRLMGIDKQNARLWAGYEEDN